MAQFGSQASGYAVHGRSWVVAVGPDRQAARALARRTVGWRACWLRTSPASADLIHEAEQRGAGISFVVGPDGVLSRGPDREHARH